MALPFLILAYQAHPVWALDTEGTEEPFKPNWANSLKYSHLGEGGQQVGNTLDLDLTRNLSSSGGRMSLTLEGGSQKQEGKKIGFGGATVGGGFGVGRFTPSLSLTGQAGGNRTQSLTGTAGLDIALPASFTLGATGSYGRQAHEGTLAGLLTGKVTDKGDAKLFSRNEGWNATLTYAGPWEWLSLAATAGRSWNTSLWIEGPKGKVKKDLNITGYEDSASVGPSFLIGSRWTLAVDFVAGRDVAPGAGYYNPRTGNTTVLGAASDTRFHGASTSLQFDL